MVITFLETGMPPEGLFDPDVFLDFTMSTWRLQARGTEDTLAARRAGHPTPGRVPRSRFDPTPSGFVLEVEEIWAESSRLMRTSVTTGASCRYDPDPDRPVRWVLDGR